MTTKEFLPVAQKLINTGLISVLEKGQHGNLGGTYIGRTDAQNTKLWRKCGCLSNIVVFKTADEANAILEANGVTEFYAKPTKSGTMCRLHVK